MMTRARVILRDGDHAMVLLTPGWLACIVGSRSRVARVNRTLTSGEIVWRYEATGRRVDEVILRALEEVDVEDADRALARRA